MRRMHGFAFGIQTSYGVRVSPDERTVFAATGSRVQRWDVESATLSGSLRHRDLCAVDISPDGQRLLAGTSSGACLLVDPETLQAGPKLYGGRRKLSPGALFGPDGRHYVQLGWDGNLVVRDATTGEWVLQERDEGRMLNFLACTSDRSTFAWVSETADDAFVRIRRWPFTENETQDAMRLPGVRPGASSLAIADDGRIALHESSAYEPARISIWEAGNRTAARESSYRGTQDAIAWSADGTLVATDGGETRDHRLIALSPTLDTCWMYPLSYTCATTVSRSGDLIVAGSWEKGAVLRRHA
jgi:WD40 repeat protein